MNKKIMCFVLAAFISALICAPASRAQTWTNLGTGMSNGTVYAFVFDTNGWFCAGGNFTNAGNAAGSRIAGWNGNSWANFGPGISSSAVYALARREKRFCHAQANFEIGSI